MKQLFLLRHAEAAPQRPNLADYERELSSVGAADARAIGRRMAERSQVPEIALCSKAQRARATMDVLNEALPRRPKIIFKEELYSATAADILNLIRGLGDYEPNRLLVVGHNPAIADLARDLVGQGDPAMAARLTKQYPPGGLSVFALHCPNWGDLQVSQAELRRFENPSSVRR